MKQPAEKPKYHISYALPVLSALIAADTAYITNTIKVGAYHIWLCAGLSVLAMLAVTGMIVWCIRMLRIDKPTWKFTAAVMVLTILLGAMWFPDSVSFFRDIASGSRTVTTDSYLVASKHLYFLDEDGAEVTLRLPEETAAAFRNNENYAYDAELNQLRYYRPISVTYYPNSGIIAEAYITERS